jgi:beta-N-acetylhexosaminidase
MGPAILEAVTQAEKVVAGVFIIPSAGKRVQAGGQLTNSVALSDATGSLFGQVIQAAAGKTIAVSFGSPYFVGDFPGTENYMCTFSNSTLSETAAVRALFGEIPIHGRLPVTISNVAQRGAGIERSASSGGSSHGSK